MASAALEERINKIRLQNEEIRRRYEEVEADKKNAAKLDALIEPIPAEDWPERKEPPEFSAPPPKYANKPKQSAKRNNDQGSQYHASGVGGADGKKVHNFADGRGPPPDPKYNFLADSERDEHGEENTRDAERNRGRGKATRGSFKRRGSGRDWHTKEQWNQQGSPGDATRPDYEAWRAERNRIDEARISRQRTAEGNWRREWDNDKVHLANAASRRDRVALDDVAIRQDHGDNDKLYRSPRSAPRNSPQSNPREAHHGSAVSETMKFSAHVSAHDHEKRIVVATEKSIKVSVNPGSTPPKSSVMSVKVSPSNIAGTGRVGPRQRPRVMYSSNSDVEPSANENPIFTKQKSADDKSHGRSFDHAQKAVPPKSPHAQRKRDGDPKSPYPLKKDMARGDKIEGMPPKSIKKDSQKLPYSHKRGNVPSNYPPKSPRADGRSAETVKNDSVKFPRAQRRLNPEKSDTNAFTETSEVESVNGIEIVARDASAASNDDETSELIGNFDNFDGNNENAPMKKFSPEKSDYSASVDLEIDERWISPEARKNNSERSKDGNVVSRTSSGVAGCAENDFTNESENRSVIGESENAMETGNCRIISNEAGHEPSTSSAVNGDRSFDSAENSTATAFDEICGEASGSRESTNASSSVTDDGGSTSDRTVISCSADSSGITSNDSGFLELPSNDSSRDVSGNSNVETSDFAETSVDSFQSQTDSVEIPLNVNDLAIARNNENPTTSNDKSSSGDSEKTGENNFRAAKTSCDAESGGLASDDGEFLELPSNDSSHDVSGNSNVEMSDFAETSVDSFQSQTDSVEIPLAVNNLAIARNNENSTTSNVDESSSVDSKKMAENSSTNFCDETPKISHE